jgi:Spy/CpxP family protein refolding chaperone
VTLGVLLFAGAALAQEEPPTATGRSARDEAFRMVDAYVVSNLQESLSLTDEQFAKAIPLVKKLQSERREYLLARNRAMREMRRLLQQGGASESRVLELLNEVRTLDVEGPERTRHNMAALDALLTPIQQAKYRVLEGDVEQRLRELMNRGRAARPGGREGTRPPPE